VLVVPALSSHVAPLATHAFVVVVGPVVVVVVEVVVVDVVVVDVVVVLVVVVASPLVHMLSTQ